MIQFRSLIKIFRKTIQYHFAMLIYNFLFMLNAQRWIAKNRCKSSEFECFQSFEFSDSSQQIFKKVAISCECTYLTHIRPTLPIICPCALLFICSLEILCVFLVNYHFYEVIQFCVHFADKPKHYTLFTQNFSKKFSTSCCHFYIFLSFQIQSEFRYDYQIFFSAVAQFKILTFMPLWIIINFREIFLLMRVSWRFFKHFENTRSPLNFFELEIAFPAKRFFTFHLKNLIFKFNFTPSEFAPS